MKKFLDQLYKYGFWAAIMTLAILLMVHRWTLEKVNQTQIKVGKNKQKKGSDNIQDVTNIIEQLKEKADKNLNRKLKRKTRKIKRKLKRKKNEIK